MRQDGRTPVIRRYTVSGSPEDEHLPLPAGDTQGTGGKNKDQYDLAGKSEWLVQLWAYTLCLSTPT